MDIADIRTIDVQKHLTEQKTRGGIPKFGKGKGGYPLANSTIIKLRQFIIAAMKQAVFDDLTDKNYAEMTMAMPMDWRDSPVFSEEARKDFLNASKNHRDYPAYMLLFYLGMRRSEVLGLPWSNVNFEEKYLAINQTLTVINGVPTINPATKTKGSVRILPLVDKLINLLKNWQERQKIELKKHRARNQYNLVFADKNGGLPNPEYFSRNFKTLVRKIASCDNRLHVHSTRHSWATAMMHLGVSLTDVQYLGGWSRPGVLLDIYAHTLQDSQRDALRMLSQKFNVQ